MNGSESGTQKSAGIGYPGGKASAAGPAGIGSFAFRYAVGFGGFAPPAPVSAYEFLNQAHLLGYGGVQLCENLGYASLDDEAFRRLRVRADELGMFIEVGMKNLTPQNLARHLEIARMLSAGFIRIVLADTEPRTEQERSALYRSSLETLRSALPDLERADVHLGIENHFDLRTVDLVRLVDEVDSPRIGLVFDTTNSLGFLQPPEETLRLMGHRVRSVHLKDYVIRKVEAGYFITGTTLGDGELDVQAVLATVRELNPRASIILEMTVRRQDGQSPADVIEWEREQIRLSTQRFTAALST